MRETTTIRVSAATRDLLRALAQSADVSMDEMLRRLLRQERQRRIGDVLAQPLSEEESAWVAGGSAAVGRATDAGR